MTIDTSPVQSADRFNPHLRTVTRSLYFRSKTLILLYSPKTCSRFMMLHFMTWSNWLSDILAPITRKYLQNVYLIKRTTSVSWRAVYFITNRTCNDRQLLPTQIFAVVYLKLVKILIVDNAWLCYFLKSMKIIHINRYNNIWHISI